MVFAAKIKKKAESAKLSAELFVDEFMVLMHRMIQVSLQEERLGGKEEESHAGTVDQNDAPERSGITHKFGDDSTEEYSQTYADVPRHEDGGVGSASLVVVCHVDGHVLEGGPHVTIAQSDEQCGTVVAHFN